MKRNILGLLLPLVAVSCTSISSKNATFVGTDGGGITYRANANTGEVLFVSNELNNSNAFGQLAKTARFGLGIWGATSIADSVAGAITSTKNAATAANLGAVQAGEATKQASIAADSTVRLAEIEAEAALLAP